MKKPSQLIDSTQLPNNDIYLKSLDRLESYITSADFQAATEAFVEERLDFFRDCPEAFLPRLFEIAHKVVANQLTEATFFSENTQPMVVEANLAVEANRKRLHAETKIKAKLGPYLPDNMVLGAAISEGDCFFDAVAQSINQLIGKKQYTAKFLRLLCDAYAKDSRNTWVKEAIIKDKDNYEQYLTRIQFTAAEMKDNERKGLKLGPAVGGRAAIEGRMICEKLNLKLHIINIPEEHKNLIGQLSITEQLVDARSSRSIEAMKKTTYDDPHILHVVVSQLHFVPLINNKLAKSTAFTMTPSGELSSFTAAFPATIIIHPVYGAVIQVFFQNTGYYSPQLEIQFFQKAGDNYHQCHYWNVAIGFYRRAYKQAQLFNVDNSLLAALKEKLNQLEFLIYSTFFLALENNQLSSLSLTTLEEKVTRLLTIVDHLTQEKLNKAVLACYQAPLLTRYLERLGSDLQRLTGKKKGRALLQQVIDEKILPLAEWINVHVTLNKNLPISRDDCYKLVYNVMRDHDLKLPDINQQLFKHQNTLHEKSQQTQLLLDSLKNTLTPVWSNPTRVITEPLSELHQVADEKFLKYLADHTTNVVQLVQVLCQRLQTVLGAPPCPFLLIGFGSSARSEMLSTSDLDIALLVDDKQAGLQTLRSHSYFMHFLQALNQLLQLCDGKWHCAKQVRQIDDNSVPTYSDKETQYYLMAAGLRIDAMDLDQIETIINTPQGMAEWVVHHCASLDKSLAITNRILSYGLLNPIKFYSSEISNNTALLDLYLSTLTTLLNQAFVSNQTNLAVVNDIHPFAYFRNNLKNEPIRLLEVWQKHSNWRKDQPYLFVKQNLWLLDFWSLMIITALDKKYVHSTTDNFEKRLLILEKTKTIKTYFLQGIRRYHVFLLKIKYLIDHDDNFQKTVNWEEWETYIIHSLLPAVFQIAQDDSILLINNNDPYLAMLKHTNSNLLNKSLPIFTSQSIAWLNEQKANSEDYQAIYHELLNKGEYKHHCAAFVDQSRTCFGLTSSNVQSVIVLPDAYGYRQSERLAYEQLDKDLMAITLDKEDDLQELQVKLTWANAQNNLCERQLRPELISSLIEIETGQLKRQYANSRHAVVAINTEDCHLHFKAYPDQPMMDYAIDIFQCRLLGHGSPANTLARLVINNKTGSEIAYPVFISQTSGELNLREALKIKPTLKINPICYSEMILAALLTGAGDAASRNFVLKTASEIKMNDYAFEAVIGIDNEQQFVEPIIKETTLSGFNKVQFQHIFFCLEQANDSLEKSVLEQFTTRHNFYGLLGHWEQAVQQRETVYLKLYASSEERQALYNRSKDDRFTPRCLIREGVLGELLINLAYLQNYISLALVNNKVKLPSALDLLEQINFRLGHYYRDAFRRHADPEKRFQAATGAPQASVSSSLALKASLGIVPTFEQTEGENKYSLTEARKEIQCLLDFKPDFSKLVDAQGKADINRQRLMLKALSIYPHKELCLSHCVVLDDDLLKLVLTKSFQLRSLDLRACPQLTSKAIKYLALQHPSLEKLYLSDNPGITAIDNGALVRNVLYWPNLKVLHLSRCVNLLALKIKAPQLTELKDSGCTALKSKTIQITDIANQQTNSSVKDKEVETKKLSKTAILPKGFSLSEDGIEIRAVVISNARATDDKSKCFDLYFQGYAKKDVKIGANFCSKKIVINNQQAKIICWDNQCEERFQILLPTTVYRAALLLIFTYASSYEEFTDPLKNYNKMIGENFIVLIGMRRNSDDPAQAISIDTARAAAKEYGIDYYLECIFPADINNLKLEKIKGLKEAFETAFELTVEHSGILESVPWKEFSANNVKLSKNPPAIFHHPLKLPINSIKKEEDKEDEQDKKNLAINP